VSGAVFGENLAGIKLGGTVLVCRCRSVPTGTSCRRSAGFRPTGVPACAGLQAPLCRN